MSTIGEQKRLKAEGMDVAKDIEDMEPEEFDTLFETLPLTPETTCGYWFFKGWLQR